MKTAARRFGTTLTLTAMMVAFTATGAFADYDPSPKAPPEVEAKVDQILGFGLYLVGGLAFAGFLIVGAVLMLGNDSGRGGRDGVTRLWYVLGGCGVVACVGPLVAYFM